MKHILIALALVSCFANATPATNLVGIDTVYSMNPNDCQGLMDVAEASVLYRDNDVPIEAVKVKLRTTPRMEEPEYKAMLAPMIDVVKKVYAAGAYKTTVQYERHTAMTNCQRQLQPEHLTKG